jgi:hypothetical protein
MSSSPLRPLHEDGADSENPTGATRLYERVGMSVLRQSNTWELELEQ